MIAVNPFMKLPHLYDLHMMDQYRGAIFGELSPHVFAVADSAYRCFDYPVLVCMGLVSCDSDITNMLMTYESFFATEL